MRRDGLRAGALALVGAGLWCLVYGRTSATAWQVPIDYHGDAWPTIALLKAAADGHLVPLRPIHVPELGAPFGADWNGYLRPHGEIIKGHVSLGSLRIRQGYLIAEGLLAPYAGAADRSPKAEALALTRIRQLSAHEVGHTLGLSHNYIASSQGRASVMDYPHPRVTLRADGRVDLSDAYATGIGEWDRVSIIWGYQDFPDGTDQRAALDA